MNREKDEGCHVPVLLSEMLAAIKPSEGKRVVDACFGGGGYSRALLDSGAHVVAFDRDPMAIALGSSLVKESQGRLTLIQDCFSKMADYIESVDAVVFDLGVSSLQLDKPERGFSFRYDGPLDMRMSPFGLSAADVVNHYTISDLARIFNFLGEERYAGGIARMIYHRREKKPFTRTLDLADSIKDYVGGGGKQKIHPATRIFQALRIYINNELTELVYALHASERILRPDGNLVVVSFHSLEDRIVKRFIADRSQSVSASRHMPPVDDKVLTFKKLGNPFFSTEEEIKANTRSRSAKMRVAQRTQFPMRSLELSLFNLPKLPKLPLEK